MSGIVPLPFSEVATGIENAGQIGLRAEGRNLRELRLDQDLEIGLDLKDVLADDPIEIEMDGCGLAAHRFAKRLA